MNDFLLPLKSAIPDKMGIRNASNKNAIEILYENIAELFNVNPKKLMSLLFLLLTAANG